MNVPTNLFMWIMACLPIIVLLLLLIKFQWGATEAAPIGLLITIITAVAFYKADFTLLASETAKGIWSALPILLIVWTAILLYQVADEAKAFLVIRNGMRKLLPNELLLVLALGWILESFLQGITGFGVPVAVGAPLLIGIGMHPMWAVILPLLGQSWGNTFGTLAAAWDSLASTSGLTTGSPEYFAAALWASAFLFVWDVITGLIMCWFYGKGAGVKKGLPAVLILAVIQGGGELLLSQVNTTLSCFIPSCVSLVALFLIGRMKMYREEWKLEDSPIMNRAGTTAKEEEGPSDMSLLQAFVPYFILTALTIIVLVVKPINEFLGQFSIGFSFAETSTGYGFVNQAVESFSPLVPFTHASMFLFLSSIVGQKGRHRTRVCKISGNDHAVRYCGHRTGDHVQDHGRHRTDGRPGGRDLPRAGQGLCDPVTGSGTDRNIYDSQQYVLEYSLWRVPVYDCRTSGTE